MKHRYVVVHAGRRDNYQVAVALHSVGNLYCLVTDFYSPIDKLKLFGIWRFLPTGIKNRLYKRYISELFGAKVVWSYPALVFGVLYRITGNQKFSFAKDKILGELARDVAIRTSSNVLSMSTYAQYAFRGVSTQKVLFQFHPHVSFVKKVLLAELERNPVGKTSIMKEYEFTLPNERVQKLSEEIDLADKVICASSFTARSVLDASQNSEVHIVPYGVSLMDSEFEPIGKRSGSFKVLFVGSLNQRKGVTYLIQAINSIPDKVELTIVGRGISDSSLLLDKVDNLRVYNNVPDEELRSLYLESDCLVLPSIVEGFGQVILEALSFGTPVIASTNSAGPDILRNDYNGFIVEPGSSEEIKQALLKMISNPSNFAQMKMMALVSSKAYSWENFRLKILEILCPEIK